MTSEIPGQLSLFRTETEISAARYVALNSSPYWTTSWDAIKAVQDDDIKAITRVVKHEFCPYGISGHYGSEGRYVGYDMKKGGIKVYIAPANDDEFSDGEEKVTWEDFAREVIDLIWSGEKGGGE